MYEVSLSQKGQYWSPKYSFMMSTKFGTWKSKPERKCKILVIIKVDRNRNKKYFKKVLSKHHVKNPKKCLSSFFEADFT